MSQRTARLVSRSIFGLALVMIAATGVVAVATIDDAEPGQLLVIPADRAAAIEEEASFWVPGASGLDGDCRRDEDAPEPDPALGDAPAVYCDLQDRRAQGDDLTPDAINLGTIVGLGALLLWLATGSLIVSRQPRNAAGWLFHAVGFSLIVELLAGTWVFVGTKAAPGSVPFVGGMALLTEYALVTVILLPLLWLLFPDGRPPSARWRWPLRLYVAAFVLAVVAVLFTPGALNNLVDLGIVYLNPLGVPAMAEIGSILQQVGVMTALVIAVATVFAVRGRYRRATGEQRQQIRWLRFVTTIGIGSLIMMFVGGIGLEIAVGSEIARERFGWWFPFWFSMAAVTIGLGLPAAYLIAIFKHGLWDLDVVVKKTVQYAVIVVAMALIAVIVVVAIPALVLGSSVDVDFWLVVLLAALLAAAFTLIRGPARRMADRVVYGKRATPYEVLSAFGARVGGTYSTDDVLPRMAQLVAEATGARRVDVWVRVGSSLRPEATHPPDATLPNERPVRGDVVPPANDGEFVAEVRHLGELLGAITLEQPPDDPMNPARESLLGDLAAQAGLVLRNVRLIEELRASRQRLVAAQDEERRKLERNIHDGAQQQLVALAVKLRLTEQLSERDPAKAREMLTQLQADANAALEDLRDLARGIYPPLLADKGLAAALEAQIRKVTVPMEVHADGIGRYQQDLEAAVYFCCLEALNNVAKYADASGVTIDLSERNGALTFEVRDDGRGFDPAGVTAGTGVQGMADRLDAIGGSLQVESAPGSGTTVRGRIPTVRVG